MNQKNNKKSYSFLESEDPDHIYYNIVIPYQDNPMYNSTVATFVENRTQPILEKCDDWYVSIIRFYVPAESIPITALPILPFPNLNVNLTNLSIILSYNGINSNETILTYVPENNLVLPPNSATATNPNYPITPYYYIYNYQNVIDIANNAIIVALANLKTKPGTGAIATATAPFFTYNPITQLITLTADQTFYDTNTAVNLIKFYFNAPFFTFFGAFPTLLTNLFLFNVNSFTYQFLIKNNGINTTGTTINFSQEYVTIGLWNIFKSLVFISGTVPVNAELIPSTDGSGNVIGRRILTDYDPLINDKAGQSNSILQYYPQGPYRLISMISSTPLTKFDITLYWQDKSQNLYPLYILFDNVVTIKILFVKKNVYNGKNI